MPKRKYQAISEMAISETYPPLSCISLIISFTFSDPYRSGLENAFEDVFEPDLFILYNSFGFLFSFTFSCIYIASDMLIIIFITFLMPEEGYIVILYAITIVNSAQLIIWYSFIHHIL